MVNKKLYTNTQVEGKWDGRSLFICTQGSKCWCREMPTDRAVGACVSTDEVTIKHKECSPNV